MFVTFAPLYTVNRPHDLLAPIIQLQRNEERGLRVVLVVVEERDMVAGVPVFREDNKRPILLTPQCIHFFDDLLSSYSYATYMNVRIRMVAYWLRAWVISIVSYRPSFSHGRLYDKRK